MRAAVGPFDLDLPGGWGVVVDGSRDGVVVVDPLASASEGEAVAGAVRPNVVLRYWVEESGGGVGVGAPRE